MTARTHTVRKIAIALLGALAMGDSQAQASRHPTPHLTMAQRTWVADYVACPVRVRPFVVAAVAYWHGERPEAVTIRFTNLNVGQPLSMTYGETYFGKAAASPAIMALDFGLWRQMTNRQRALLVTHEYGHAIGRVHTRSGIMSPYVQITDHIRYLYY